MNNIEFTNNIEQENSWAFYIFDIELNNVVSFGYAFYFSKGSSSLIINNKVDYFFKIQYATVKSSQLSNNNNNRNATVIYFGNDWVINNNTGSYSDDGVLILFTFDNIQCWNIENGTIISFENNMNFANNLLVGNKNNQ